MQQTSKNNEYSCFKIFVISLIYRLLGIEKKETLETVDIECFLVKVKYDRTVINTTDLPPSQGAYQDKFEFMNDIEKDAHRRASERKRRESMAQELRKWVFILFNQLRMGLINLTIDFS